MIYSFDPGQMNGIATGSSTGKLSGLKQVGWEDFPKYLDEIKNAELFIIEEFRIRPDKAMSFSFSDMKTIQTIGMLRYRAHQLKTPMKFQRPTDKTIGYRWSGTPPPKNHSLSHQTDAYAHLVFHWVHTLGLEPPAAAKAKPLDSIKRDAVP